MSCEREDNPLESAADISKEDHHLRSSGEFNLDDFQACFDEIADGLNGPIFVERFGSDSGVRIQYEHRDNQSTVIPLVKDQKINSLIWMNSENDSYIISNSSYLPEEEREGTNISPGSVKIFDLTSDEINDLTEMEIQRELGAGFTVKRGSNTIHIRESDNVIILENGFEEDDVIRPLCDYSELVDFYMIYFGLKDEDGNDTGQYEFDLQIFVDAITTAVPNDGTCYCIKPCEVSSELGANPNVGPYSMNLLNQHLIANTINLGGDFPLDVYSSDQIANIVGINCGSIIPDEIINDGFIFDANNIDRICEDLFMLNAVPNGFEQDIGFQTGLSGLNVQFLNPDGSELILEINELWLWIEDECLEDNYAMFFANSIQQAYAIFQQRITDGEFDGQSITDIRGEFAKVIDSELAMFRANCSPQTNLADADVSSGAVIKENRNGLGEDIIFTAINQNTLDQFCP